MRETLRPLRVPGFPHLAGGYFVNELGNWLGLLALAVLVFDETGSAVATTALFLATQFLPALLAPAVVARFEPLRTGFSLPALYLGEAAAFLGLALVAGSFSLPLLLALAAVDGVLATSSRALTRGVAGALLSPPGLLREGNALLNVGFTAGAAVGPAIAGVLVASAGPQAALFGDAGSFLAVALLLAAAPGLPGAQPDAGGWRTRLRDGLGYVRGRPLLVKLLSVQAAAFVFFAAVIPIEVVFAKRTLDAGDGGYGALLASWGGGMLAGSLLFALLRRVELRTLLVLGTAAISVSYLVTAAAPTLWVACLAAVAGGIGNGVQSVSIVSALQELSQTSYHARVIALLESAATAMPGAGFLIGGAVAAIVTPRAAYAVAGAGVACVLVIAFMSLRREAWASASAEVRDADRELLQSAPIRPGAPASSP
jgi:MFS family permease